MSQNTLNLQLNAFRSVLNFSLIVLAGFLGISFPVAAQMTPTYQHHDASALTNFSELGGLQVAPERWHQGDTLILIDTSENSSPVQFTFRGYDLSDFPNINILLELKAKNRLHADSIVSHLHLVASEAGVPLRFTLSRVTKNNRIPIDFVMVLDETGSMRHEIDDVRRNIHIFAERLSRQGTDFQIGLLTFSDTVGTKYGFTENVETFINWIDRIHPWGGGDEKENSLEALNAAMMKFPFRPGALRVFILITDAAFHQRGEHGDGTTNFTAEGMAFLLRDANIRTYCVAPLDVKGFKILADVTGGKVFDIRSDFSSVLDEVSQSARDLWALQYHHSKLTFSDTVLFVLEDTSRRDTLLRTHFPLFAESQRLVIRNPLFEFNRATLQKEYMPDLNRIVEILRANPELAIRVEGHADEIGSDEYNMALSLRRAETVKNYLVQQGISPNRIAVKGYGKTKPIAPNDTEEGRQKNRRVEFTILRQPLLNP
ncbi:MAG: OmpA family protein [Bacteroidota bacterium]